MGFWSSFGFGRAFQFVREPASPHLRAALEQAARRPLDDHTTRIVIASPDGSLIGDVGLHMRSSGLDMAEKRNIHQVRRELLPGLRRATGLKGLSDEQRGAVAFGALAYFDRAFTRGANAGKTNETAWNTLMLDINDEMRVTRSACRIEYPTGPVDLSFDGLLRGLVR